VGKALRSGACPRFSARPPLVWGGVELAPPRRSRQLGWVVHDDALALLIVGGRTTLRYVRIPYGLPFIFSGIELGGLYAIPCAIVAEFVGASAGIGNGLIAMNVNLDTSSAFALLFVLRSTASSSSALSARSARARVVLGSARRQRLAQGFGGVTGSPLRPLLHIKDKADSD
jgi:hypothetical protein